MTCVSQMNSGLTYLLGFPNTAWVQVGLIVVVMAAATASVARESSRYSAPLSSTAWMVLAIAAEHSFRQGRRGGGCFGAVM